MQVETTTITEIAEEKVEFLTFPYIPLGKLSLITGDPNVGKTHIALAIAAAVTTGEPLPWEPEQSRRKPADTIFESMEDGYGDTIKPRLLRLGADCDRVHVINEGRYPLTLDDARIEQAIVKTNAKLVIFDPLTAYCNGFEMTSSGGIRPILTQLAEMAARTNCAIVCICHLNKSGGKSQYRTLGSIDISAIARSVLTVGKIPDDEEIRCFVHGKSNLTAPGKPQAFAFDSNSRLEWLGDYSITLDELLDGKMNPKKHQQQKQPSQLETAQQFITTALSNGVTSAAEIKTLAGSAGISKNTLDRAKSALGVKSKKQGDNWYWELPAADEQLYDEHIHNEQPHNEQPHNGQPHNEQPQDTQDIVCTDDGVLGVLELSTDNNSECLEIICDDEQQRQINDITAVKVGMSRQEYVRALYIADNAPPEIIEQLDRRERTIDDVYNELRAKEDEN